MPRRIFWLQPRVERDATNNELLLEVLREVRELRKEVRQMQQQVEAAFEELKAEVQSVHDTEEAAVTALEGVRQQLNDALNSSDDPNEIVDAVQAIHDQLQTDSSALAAAVAAGTEQSPAPAPAGDQGAAPSGDTPTE